MQFRRLLLQLHTQHSKYGLRRQILLRPEPNIPKEPLANPRQRHRRLLPIRQRLQALIRLPLRLVKRRDVQDLIRGDANVMDHPDPAQHPRAAPEVGGDLLGRQALHPGRVQRVFDLLLIPQRPWQAPAPPEEAVERAGVLVRRLANVEADDSSARRPGELDDAREQDGLRGPFRVHRVVGQDDAFEVAAAEVGEHGEDVACLDDFRRLLERGVERRFGAEVAPN